MRLHLVLSASFKPFSLEFKPLLDEIATQEKDLKDLASSFTVMTAISMSPFSIKIDHHPSNTKFVSENSTYLEKMKDYMEEWGCSVTEKLDGTAPLHIGAQPSLPSPYEEN